jgi:hypothetical protein
MSFFRHIENLPRQFISSVESDDLLCPLCDTEEHASCSARAPPSTLTPLAFIGDDCRNEPQPASLATVSPTGCSSPQPVLLFDSILWQDMRVASRFKFLHTSNRSLKNYYRVPSDLGLLKHHGNPNAENPVIIV